MLNYSKALPFYPAYEYLNHSVLDFPAAFENQDKILSLPIYPELTNNQQEYIVSCIKQFFKNID